MLRLYSIFAAYKQIDVADNSYLQIIFRLPYIATKHIDMYLQFPKIFIIILFGDPETSYYEIKYLKSILTR